MCSLVAPRQLPMAKGKKTSTAVQQVFPGMIFSQDRTSIGFRMDQVRPSDLFFYATDFRMAVQERELIVQFGSNSRFAEPEMAFDRALEIYMSLEAATDCFVANVFERDSTKGHPFIRTLENAIPAETRPVLETYTCQRPMPTDTAANFRPFTSNYASSTVFNSQCNIEFFLIPFSFVAFQHTKVARPGDEVRSLLNVQIPAKLMYAFFFAARSMLPKIEKGHQ